MPTQILGHSRSTANRAGTTDITSQSVANMTLTAATGQSLAVTQGAILYLAVLIGGQSTTQWQLACGGPSTRWLVNFGITAGPYYAGTISTGLTALPASFDPALMTNEQRSGCVPLGDRLMPVERTVMRDAVDFQDVRVRDTDTDGEYHERVWKPGTPGARAADTRAALAAVIAELESAATNWANLTTAQRTAATGAAVGAVARLCRFVLDRFD
jgi:hypothetical protein